MKLKLNYPVNGCDLDLFIDGQADGQFAEIHKLIAKFKNVEVFRFDEDEAGLLAGTGLSSEIMNIAQSLLIETNDEVQADY
jgi:hypothetical protein